MQRKASEMNDDVVNRCMELVYVNRCLIIIKEFVRWLSADLLNVLPLISGVSYRLSACIKTIFGNLIWLAFKS